MSETVDQGQEPFDTWFAALPEAERNLVAEHLRPLTSALEKERAERQRDMAELERLTAQESDVADLQVRIRKAQLRESVFMGAQRAGCVNPAAALALVDELKLTLGETTEVDWSGLRASAPELFRLASYGSADGGAGTGRTPTLSAGDYMNRAIREASQRIRSW